MEEFLNTLIKDHARLNKGLIYFGNKQNLNEHNNVINCSISDFTVQTIMSHFIKYPNKKDDFKHIIALDKELFIRKEHNTCIRQHTLSSNFITFPDKERVLCVTTKKIEKLKEIDFPSSNKYQKNVNCSEYIFTIHDKIKLIVHTENKNTSVFLDITIDDYIDTTVQYLKSGIIEQISNYIE
tara:strand:- start:3 stop:548 length:546 start_codon:yes stop_codon:yes gene_type:complete